MRIYSPLSWILVVLPNSLFLMRNAKPLRILFFVSVVSFDKKRSMLHLVVKSFHCGAFPFVHLSFLAFSCFVIDSRLFQCFPLEWVVLIVPIMMHLPQLSRFQFLFRFLFWMSITVCFWMIFDCITKLLHWYCRTVRNVDTSLDVFFRNFNAFLFHCRWLFVFE